MHGATIKITSGKDFNEIIPRPQKSGPAKGEMTTLYALQSTYCKIPLQLYPAYNSQPYALLSSEEYHVI
jgi:hypothetical protein